MGIASHALQIADMVRAVREGAKPLLEGREAKHAVEVILSIYESARTGQGGSGLMVILSAFADEISAELNEQIAALQRGGHWAPGAEERVAAPTCST